MNADTLEIIDSLIAEMVASGNDAQALALSFVRSDVEQLRAVASTCIAATSILSNLEKQA